MCANFYRPNKFYLSTDTFGKEKNKGAGIGFGPKISDSMIVKGLNTTPGA